MKKRMLENYTYYIRKIQQKTRLEKLEHQLRNPQDIDDTRILHYKSDILLSLLLNIQKKEQIPFDSFTAFLDFSFIEETLNPFPLQERFQIIEFLLKKYIQALKETDEKHFILSFSILDLTNVLKDRLNEEKIKTGSEEYFIQKENLPLLESIFSKNYFKFDKAKQYLNYLGFNEHFAHFFLKYLQEKYQKKESTLKDIVKYYFTDNRDFIYHATQNEVMKKLLERAYFSKEHIDIPVQEGSREFHFEILNLLEGNYGENFIGYYENLYEIMKTATKNKEEIFELFAKVLLNDMCYLELKKKKEDSYEIYDEVKTTFEKNLSFPIDQIKREKLLEALTKIQFPEEIKETFLDYLIENWKEKQTISNIPAYKKEIKEEQVKPEQSKDPFFEQDLKEKERTQILYSLLNDEEKEIYNQTLEYLALKNTAIKGYCKELEECTATLNDLAELVQEKEEEKQIVIDLIQLEIEKIKEIFLQINMIIPYVLKRKK